MKRRIALFLLSLMVLSACSGGGEKPTDSAPPSEASPASNPDETSGIAVDENLLAVDITIPSVWYEGKTEEEIIAAAEEDGATAAINADGSVTLTMSKAAYRELLETARQSVDEYLAELIAEEGTSIQDITPDADYAVFTVIVDKAAFLDSLTDGFAGFGISLVAGFYHTLSDNADCVVVVNYQDAATGEVFDTFTLN